MSCQPGSNVYCNRYGTDAIAAAQRYHIRAILSIPTQHSVPARPGLAGDLSFILPTGAVSPPGDRRDHRPPFPDPDTRSHAHHSRPSVIVCCQCKACWRRGRAINVFTSVSRTHHRPLTTAGCRISAVRYLPLSVTNTQVYRQGSPLSPLQPRFACQLTGVT